MQPMLEPSFSNSLIPLKVSAFKHGLCTALDRHQHSVLSVEQGTGIQRHQHRKMCQAELYCCAGNSPFLCVHTQHPGKGK